MIEFKLDEVNRVDLSVIAEIQASASWAMRPGLLTVRRRRLGAARMIIKILGRASLQLSSSSTP